MRRAIRATIKQKQKKKKKMVFSDIRYGLVKRFKRPELAFPRIIAKMNYYLYYIDRLRDNFPGKLANDKP